MDAYLSIDYFNVGLYEWIYDYDDDARLFYDHIDLVLILLDRLIFII